MTAPANDYRAQILAYYLGSWRTLDRWGQLTLTKQRGQTISWELSMDDSYAERNPDNLLNVGDTNPGGRTIAESWQGWLDAKSYDDSNNIIRKLHVSGTLAGVPFYFPTLIPGYRGYTVNAKAPIYRFTQRGKGLAERATRRNESKTSLSPGLNVQQAIAQIFALVGISTDTSGLSPAYTLPRVNLQGQALKWATDLLFPIQGTWREDGDFLRFYVPYFPSSGVPSSVARTYDLGSDLVRPITRGTTSSDIYNAVTVQRTLDQGATLATLEGKKFGAQSFQAFSKRVSVDAIKVAPKTQVGGAVSDIWLYDNDDWHGLPSGILNPRTTPPPIHPTGFAQGCLAHFEKTVFTEDFALEGLFKVLLRASDDTILNPDQADPVTLGVTGPGQILYEAPASTYFDGTATMNICAQRILDRVSKQQNEITIAVPFDPLLEVDMWIRIYDPNMNRWSYGLIDTVRHVLHSAYDVRGTEFTATEYV